MPLYDRILDTIHTQITDGTLSEGTMLPKETELCKAYGVSRTTVRTALLKLQNEGLIKRIKGKGTIVTSAKVLEQSTIFIESFAEELKRQGFKTTTEVLEFRRMKAPAEIAGTFRLKEGEQVMKLTRLRYQSGSFDQGSIVITTSYLPISLSFIENYDLETTSLHDIFKEHGLHRSDITKTISAKNLDDKEARLLGVQPGSIAIVISSFTLDQHAQPLEVCESIYPVGRNTFTLKLRT